jgi:very-short-patch-repair endonuclease
MSEAPHPRRDKGLRLAHYLKKYVGLRTTTVRDLAKYDSVLWFEKMPQEKDCQSPVWTEDTSPGTSWLEVRKQKLASCPTPPEETEAWVQSSALKNAKIDFPPLNSTIYVPDTDASVEEGEELPFIEKHLEDHPEVLRAYEGYRPKREKWAQERRRQEAIQEIYAELFRLHTQILKQGEILELVLGLGLLDWKTEKKDKTIPIRRHMVTCAVELEFDTKSGVIRLNPPSDGVRLQTEDDMLEADQRPDRSHYATLEAQLEELGEDIWDRHQLDAALHGWARAIAADTRWSPGLKPAPTEEDAPSFSFAPALILRKRTLRGMARIYDAMIEQLEQGVAEMPDGWIQLIDDDYQGDTHEEEEHEHVHEEVECKASTSSEVFFPLPANSEQKQIVEAIDREIGVLVQGPPGTGKSHTIANLICHLLATGKRVLITAETARALQVLKNKLPPSIQPLCVSLLGQGGDSFAELNKAVQEITTRQASFSRARATDKIEDLEGELDATRRERARVESEIRDLRADETIQHSIVNGAYAGSASAIAARVFQESESHGWIVIPDDAEGEPPLPSHELSRWLGILRRTDSAAVEAAHSRTPHSDELATPESFAHAVHAEAQSAEIASSRSDLHSHPAYAPIRALDGKMKDKLEEALREIESRRLALRRLAGEWIIDAVRDSLAGSSARWTSLRSLTEELSERCEAILRRLDAKTITVPENFDRVKTLADLRMVIPHFRGGGKWKKLGLFTPAALKERRYLQSQFRVDGRAPQSTVELELIQDSLELDQSIIRLQAAWGELGVSVDSRDPRGALSVVREKADVLSRVFDFGIDCQSIAEVFAEQPQPIPEPDWMNGGTARWQEVIRATRLEDDLAQARRAVETCSLALDPIRRLHDAHPVVEELSQSVKARDIQRYSEQFEALLEVEKTREEQEECHRIEAKLTDSIPELPRTVLAGVEDTVWDSRLANFAEAWQWALADLWLRKRSDPEYQRSLLQRRQELDDRINHVLAELCAQRAWLYFFDRLTRKESAALKSWREAVRQMGKGTGRSSKQARLRREARQYMDECRDSIPIWVMPRYLVAEMIDPAPDRYDLVIVDEASQLGIESLFLFFITKRLIVVGDDQQISPSGVGIADAQIAGLQQHYLEGVPHQHALGPQSSLYGNAKIRFPRNIVLREHFRCMPEIIGFSNDLCYASSGTPLDPLRAYPANRLQPLVLRHVRDGYRIGSTTSAQNPAEAEAIVEQIVGCLQDPRYRNKTMGVISLQGEAQAKLIERKLLETVEPEEIEARRLICGDSYAFQGDERDVIFLSMVAAPGETRISALSGDTFRQRFNVGVSRAKDQLWLFHTVRIEELGEACMRRRLLQYMLEPSRQTTDEESQVFESEFERAVYQRLSDRGYHVRTQVCVGDKGSHRYRIDLVVEGMRGRLAVECDGDRWHGPDRYEQDMARQRDLERAGWQFARVRGGDFYRDPDRAMASVWEELERLGIQPGGIDDCEVEPPPPAQLHDFEEDDDEELEVERVEDSDPAPKDSSVHASINQASADSDHENGEDPDLPSTDPAPSFDRSIGGRELERESGIPTKSQALSTPVAPRPPDSVLDSYQSENEIGDSETIGVVSPEGVTCAPYVVFEGEAGPDPRDASRDQIAEGLRRIIAVEGPMLAKRAYHGYLRGCGLSKLGKGIKKAMNRGLQQAIRAGMVVSEDELETGGLIHTVLRLPAMEPVRWRERGPRKLEEIPPSEVLLVARHLELQHRLRRGSEAHFRAILEAFNIKRLTRQVEATLTDALSRDFEFLSEDS